MFILIVFSDLTGKCGKFSSIGDFAEAVRTGIDKGLENDIYTFSRKPGTITNGALMRKGQWKRWMTKFINRWEEERNNDRKCIVDKFPSPSSIKKV